MIDCRVYISGLVVAVVRMLAFRGHELSSSSSSSSFLLLLRRISYKIVRDDFTLFVLWG